MSLSVNVSSHPFVLEQENGIQKKQIIHQERGVATQKVDHLGQQVISSELPRRQRIPRINRPQPLPLNRHQQRDLDLQEAARSERHLYEKHRKEALNQVSVGINQFIVEYFLKESTQLDCKTMECYRRTRAAKQALYPMVPFLNKQEGIELIMGKILASSKNVPNLDHMVRFIRYQIIALFDLLEPKWYQTILESLKGRRKSATILNGEVESSFINHSLFWKIPINQLSSQRLSMIAKLADKEKISYFGLKFTKDFINKMSQELHKFISFPNNDQKVQHLQTTLESIFSISDTYKRLELKTRKEEEKVEDNQPKRMNILEIRMVCFLLKNCDLDNKVLIDVSKKVFSSQRLKPLLRKANIILTATALLKDEKVFEEILKLIPIKHFVLWYAPGMLTRLFEGGYTSDSEKYKKIKNILVNEVKKNFSNTDTELKIIQSIEVKETFNFFGSSDYFDLPFLDNQPVLEAPADFKETVTLIGDQKTYQEYLSFVPGTASLLMNEIQTTKRSIKETLKAALEGWDKTSRRFFKIALLNTLLKREDRSSIVFTKELVENLAKESVGTLIELKEIYEFTNKDMECLLKRIKT